MLPDSLTSYRYCWPDHDLGGDPRWRKGEVDGFLVHDMPESLEDLAEDSRWPAFFPSPLCLVTTADGSIPE